MAEKLNGFKSYAISVASLGDYRAEVVEELYRQMGAELTIYAGSPAYDASIRLLSYESFGIRRLRNFYIGPDILIQKIPIFHLLRVDGLIMDLNPRVPHVWLVTAFRRLLGRPTMLWGHVWSKSEGKSVGAKLRGYLRKLSTGLVTYTEEQASIMRSIYPGKPIIAAPNALYTQSQMGFSPNQHRFRVLFVGRLVHEKKPTLLLEAFNLIAAQAPELVLTFVGDGPARGQLQADAQLSQYRDRIEFKGYISAHELLRPIYSETLVSVSPGYVGLSITQSLAFGVPMLVSEHENHSPELEAVRPEFNARFFKTNDGVALSAELLRISVEAQEWDRRGIEIVEDCRGRYSSERMAQGLIEALQRGTR